MIKIWNWFKAIGSFVRKIKEKNTSADLSNWGAELSGAYHCSDSPLFRWPIIPTAHFSDNAK
jgi:hypothetical protein